jgi:septal ring factor EnvC (AmiA/AmiB activator)
MTARFVTRTRATAAIAVLTACCTLVAQEADRSRTEAMSRRAGERLKVLHEEASRLAAEERTLLGDLRQLELEREIATEVYLRASADAAAAAATLAKLDREIRQLEGQVLAHRPELRSRVVNLYKLGRARYLRLLLSTSDLRSIGQATRMVTAMAARDQERLAAHQRRIDELAASREALQTRQEQFAVLRANAARAKGSADRAVDARNALIREIDARRDLNAQLAGELLAAQQKLQVTLTMFGSGGPAADAVPLPLAPFRGDLEWPVDGIVRQRFRGTDQMRGTLSNGIDLAANEGVPVVAIHDGMVVFADNFTGFGNLVIVDHGPQTFSLYGNLADLAVAKGAPVAQGHSVGTVGVAPNGAAGLYFELRVDGRPVDPLQWLRNR